MGGTRDAGWRAEPIGAVRSLVELRASGIFDDCDGVEEQAAGYGIGETERIWQLTVLNLSELDGQWEDGFEEDDYDDLSTVAEMERAYRDGVPPPPIIVVRHAPQTFWTGQTTSITALDGLHRVTAARSAKMLEIASWIGEATPV